MAGSMTLAGSPEPDGPCLEVVPLGGLGEFGMNMMAVSWGETLVLIDAGVMFPDAELLGVDLVIPDLTYLEQRPVKAAALVLTHGHEDHIGGVPHVLPLRGRPGLRHAADAGAARAQARGARHRRESRLVPVAPRGTVQVGPFAIEFLRVTHSMPDCVALAIHTPVGTIVHTGDFKIDQTPLDGEHFDFHRFAELGARGVLALFADSTNIDRPGFTGSEFEVVEAFEEIFASTRGQARRDRVRVEHLPDADPGGPGGAVRAQGGVRRPRHGRELADRAAARLPAGAARAC